MTKKQWSQVSKKAWRSLVYFIYPPLCHRCQTPVQTMHSLCAKCWGGLVWNHNPCRRCALPNPTILENLLCQTCQHDPPPLKKIVTPFVYDGPLMHDLILSLKYADRWDIAVLLAEHMAASLVKAKIEPDCVMPVPLHRNRLLYRKFNQAAVLGRHMASRMKTDLDVGTLKRVKNTIQGTKGRADRFRNLAEAFRLRPGASVKHKKIVLVDDVVTTGATLDACARVLRKAGARQIYGVAAARVPGLYGTGL